MTRSIQFDAKIETARGLLHERQRCQTRLQDLFLSLARDVATPLYTEQFPDEAQESLVAIFDHGIDPEPAFSGEVVSRLFLDKEKNLTLALWPVSTKGEALPWRTEVLLSNVSQFQFQWLGKKNGTPEAPFVWYNEWPKNRTEIPAMVRMTVVQDRNDISFALFFGTSEPSVTYKL